MIKNTFRSLYLSVLISLLLHWLLWFLLTSLFQFQATTLSDVQNKPIKITTISRQQLRKFKTLGIKNGAKEFSSSTKIKQLGKINSSAAPFEKKPLQHKNDPATDDFNRIQISKQDRSTKIQQRYQMLRNLGISPHEAQSLSQADFNVDFVPPEGVSQDELNSIEKIFYGFQKRTFEIYVNSFLAAYQSIVRSLPHIRSLVAHDRHLLTARVIFDRQGNIINIKIMRSSQNDDIHNLFEQTLRNMRKLPNPPKDLIEENDTLTIYYQLKINQ